MKWISITTAKPASSGIYKIKATDIFGEASEAYYEVEFDHWVYDDGFWLPCIINSYITHWCY